MCCKRKQRKFLDGLLVSNIPLHFKVFHSLFESSRVNFYFLKWNFSMPIHLLKNSWVSCIKVWNIELVYFLFVWLLSILIHKSILALFLMTRQLQSNSSQKYTLKCAFLVVFSFKIHTFKWSLIHFYLIIMWEYFKNTKANGQLNFKLT